MAAGLAEAFELLVMWTLPHSIGALPPEDLEGCPPLDMGRDIKVCMMAPLFEMKETQAVISGPLLCHADNR